MKKLSIIPLLFLVTMVHAQEGYFTIYNFTVAPKNVSTVYQIVNDYYSENKSEGVSVSLYENHFNDSRNNFTHSLVFSGSLDAMGNAYGGGENVSWSLFLTRLNQFIEDGFSSAMGTRIASYGDMSESHPVQRYYILDAEEGDVFEEGFRKFHSKHDPDGIVTMMGNIVLGNSPEGENRWVIVGFMDFKSAMGGAGTLMTEKAREERSKAWGEYMAANGGVRMIRSGLRVLLGSW